MLIFTDVPVRTKVKCIFIFVLTIIAYPLDILYDYDYIPFNADSYCKWLFLVLTSHNLSNAMLNLLITFFKSLQILLIYILVLVIFSLAAVIATSGPVHLDYYDTQKNSEYFYFNFSSVAKTFETMYINGTTANFPDLMVFKWQTEKWMLGILFYVYTFLMTMIVMNILTAVLYSNYKGLFGNIIEGLKNQGTFSKILTIAIDKKGILRGHIVKKLTNMFFEGDMKEFEKTIDDIHYHNRRPWLKRKVVEELRRKRELDKDELDDTPESEEFIPENQREKGYSRVHKKKFREIQNSFFYKWMFILINLYVAFSPIIILEVVNDERHNLYTISPYSTVEVLCILSLADNLLVYCLRGPKIFYKYNYHKVEIISTIFIICTGMVMTIFLNLAENKQSFEREVPFLFCVYSIFCLMRVYRCYELV